MTYAAAPGPLTSSFARLQFNKAQALCYIIDDNAEQCWPVAVALQTPGAPRMSDGCGNLLPYSFDIAINGHNNFNDSEWDNGSANGRLNQAQIRSLRDRGFGLLNHGDYHGLTGNFAPLDANDNVVRNHQYFFNKYGWVFRCGVRPNADLGYIPAFQALGYLAGTSQGSEAGFTFYPVAGQRPIAVEALPAGFVHLGRSFNDLTTQTGEAVLTDSFAMSNADKSATVHPIVLHGSHVPTDTFVREAMTTIATAANDTVLVKGMHAVMGYRDTIAKALISTDTIAGNVRTIEINLNNCSPLADRDDMSLLTGVPGATLQSVTVQGADSCTFNAATGLVNVFRARTLTSAQGTPRS